MSALGQIAVWELKEHLTSSRYLIVSFMCIILSMGSVSLMYNDLSIRQKRFEMHRSIRGISGMGPTVPVIARSPQPLSIFAKGVEEHAGRPVGFYSVQPANEPVGVLFDYYGEEHHLFDLFTVPDFTYVVRIAFSILALFLTFDVVSGKRETGLLRLICAHPVRRSTIIIGQWIGSYCGFLVGFVPAIVIMLLVLTISPPAALTGEHWLRLIGILLFSLLYIAIFFSLGLLISSLTLRSATSLILVLFVWIVWVIAVPRLSIVASRVVQPVKPVFSHRLEKHAILQDRSVEENSENLWAMDDAYIAKVDGQTTLGMYLSRLSPLSSYVYGCTALAHTGIHDTQDYRHRASLWDRERRRGREFVFTDISLPFDESLSNIWLDLALMIVWNAVIGMAAVVAFLRYDVR